MKSYHSPIWKVPVSRLVCFNNYVWIRGFSCGINGVQLIRHLSDCSSFIQYVPRSTVVFVLDRRSV